ncbi:MAG: hypothetical protein KDG49_08915 [Geminicoccaceae bacterium]|nr:hypothetical protein [Maritimibacter sp.]MCB1991566.1 hypothetical protein [Geminicoccaceae bacterium]
MFKRALATFLLSTLPLGALAWCPGEGSTRSVEATHPTALIFVNSAESPEDSISVYWLDYDGNRQHYFDLHPGETRRQETYLTHPWLVTFPSPGGGEVCYGIVHPLAQTGQVVIR